MYTVHDHENDGQNRMAGRAVRYFRSDPEVYSLLDTFRKSKIHPDRHQKPET